MDFANMVGFGGAAVKVGVATFDTDKLVQLFSAVGLSREDTHTAPGVGTTITIPADTAFSRFAIQVKGTAVTAWNVVHEVSLDGATFTTVLTHANTLNDADGAMKWTPGGGGYPAKFFRSRLVSITGTNVVVTILGMP